MTRLTHLRTWGLLALTMLPLGIAIGQTVSPAFTYQGRLNNGDQSVNGEADITATLFNAATDGSALGTVNLTNVPVEDGLFTVQLDFGVYSVASDARWVEIAVRSPAGSGSFTTLTPRQKLTAAPIAWYAMRPWRPTTEGGLSLELPTNVGQVNGVGIGTGLLMPTARLHVRTGAFFPSEAVRVEDGFARSQLRIATPESEGRATLQAWNGQTNTPGPLSLNVSGGNVGIGTTSPSTQLDVVGGFEADGFKLNGNGAAAGKVLMSDASGVGTWQTLVGGSQWITNGTHIGYTAGNVGAGITTPVNRLDVEGGMAIGSAFSGTNGAPADGLIVQGRMGLGTATPNSGFQLQIAGGAGAWRGAIAATGTTNSAVLGEANGVATIGGHNAALTAWSNLAINPSGGSVGIGTYTPVTPLHVNSSAYASAMVESANTAGTWFNLRNSSTGGTYWQFISSGSGNGGGAGKLFIGPGSSPSFSSSTTMTLTASGSVGIGTLSPATSLQVANGTDATLSSGGYVVAGSTTGTNIVIDNDEIIARNNGASAPLYLNSGSGHVIVPVLEITGGSDVAEPYDVAAAGDTQPQPGIVVAIDPANVGKMRVVAKAFDRTVAGIISGANGIKPGITLTQTGTVADGDLPVASIGRVWCWCDADAAGPIDAGDMLTTSDTPGHAMRVADHDKAHGAVIGKAMSSLKSGKGLVLVLVSLQ